MIAIFNSKQDAQNYSDKIYNWLLQNCPNINGICWQVPVENKAATQWYIEVPKEYYESDLYKDSDKIINFCKPEFQKVATVKEKPDPVLWDKESVQLDGSVKM